MDACDLGPADDRVQRAAQLVRERREEVVLGPIRALCLGARYALAGERRLALDLDGARAQEGVDGRDQYRGLDGVREIAVGAGLVALHLVHVVDERSGKVDHGHARRVRVGTDLLAHLVAAQVREVDVRAR
jgi:hypothetical protein